MSNLSVSAEMVLNKNGVFYTSLDENQNYSVDTRIVIERTVQKLLGSHTTVNRPGMLLGKIQSGKTRTFIGVIGLAFDNGYDVCVVLTKGTTALAQQTYQRLLQDFRSLSEEDLVEVFDIMALPDGLTSWTLNQKLIFVVKKEDDNLRRLQTAIFETYPSLSSKKIMMIDDEADFASIGFKKAQDRTIQINTIPALIDGIRENIADCDFLQVTATPYSLYLQPEELKIVHDRVFMPTRPAFTELVPAPREYVGGDVYFSESEDEDTVAQYLFQPITDETELDILIKQDRRKFKIEDVLTSPRIKTLRTAFINFVVGGSMRRIQDRKLGKTEQKYSMVIHTSQKKKAHEWQEEIALEVFRATKEACLAQPEVLDPLIKASYEDLYRSMSLLDLAVPTLDAVRKETAIIFAQEAVMVSRVNSEREVSQMLDERGQLRLRNPLNVFIGGQILDRGITISNLISFYYGRNPKKIQQDTVLQHSRMYGYRAKEDLAVTRFYTTQRIYEAMKRIHELDTALRQSFEQGGNEQGVIFVQVDKQGEVIPCSPSKIALSSTYTLKAGKRMLPVGFQTYGKTRMAPLMRELDEVIERLQGGRDSFPIDLPDALKIVEQIGKTFDLENAEPWDLRSFCACMEFLAKEADGSMQGKVWCVVRIGREMSRHRSNGAYSDAPDSPRDELTVAKNLAIESPALILLRQNGREENGWMGTPFWWPILVTPRQMKPVIFTTDADE